MKTSLAPGSQVVGEYLAKSGLQKDLDKLGFNLVGFGCTTCIGNSGPLPEEISKAIDEHDLVAAAVLSGNRNFEGRVNPDVRANYLASPPLVVAYAIAGSMQIDLAKGAARRRQGRQEGLPEGHLADQRRDRPRSSARHVTKELFAQEVRRRVQGRCQLAQDRRSTAASPISGTAARPMCRTRPISTDAASVRRRPTDIIDARVLGLFLDSITTDHISPAGSIKPTSPGGQVSGRSPRSGRVDFNQYGTRRGNHEVTTLHEHREPRRECESSADPTARSCPARTRP